MVDNKNNDNFGIWGKIENLPENMEPPQLNRYIGLFLLLLKRLDGTAPNTMILILTYL